MLGEEKVEFVSYKEIPHSFNSLTEILQDETEAQTVMGRWWAGPHLEQDIHGFYLNYVVISGSEDRLRVSISLSLFAMWTC